MQVFEKYQKYVDIYLIIYRYIKVDLTDTLRLKIYYVKIISNNNLT